MDDDKQASGAPLAFGAGLLYVGGSAVLLVAGVIHARESGIDSGPLPWIINGVLALLLMAGFVGMGALLELRARRISRTHQTPRAWSAVIADPSDLLRRMRGDRTVSKPGPRWVAVAQDAEGLTFWEGWFKYRRVGAVPWGAVGRLSGSSFAWGARRLPSIRIEPIGSPYAIDVGFIGRPLLWLGARNRTQVDEILGSWRARMPTPDG